MRLAVLVLLIALLTILPAARAAGPSVFAVDGATLALYDFNGDLLDASGNGRTATPVGGGAGAFAPALFGQGLQIGSYLDGVNWDAYKATLPPTFTMEFLFQNGENNAYRKFFSFNDGSDRGFYVVSQGINDWPTGVVGAPALTPSVWHYVAVVVTGNSYVAYIDGSPIGGTSTTFDYTAEPPSARFFSDDSATGRGEQMTSGIIDTLRISNVARTQAEISQTQCVVIGNCSPPTPPVPELGTVALVGAGVIVAGIVSLRRRQ